VTLPVLLPPEPPRVQGLPPLTAWIATLGLVVLGLLTVPATLERRRFDRVHAELTAAIARQEAELERWQRMRHEAGQPSYLRERWRRALLGAGRATDARAPRPFARPPAPPPPHVRAP
jgi:hypothetical protein